MNVWVFYWRRWIRRDLRMGRHCEIRSPATLQAGRAVLIGHNTTIDGRVVLGHDVSIGDNVFVDSDVAIGDRTVVGRMSSLMTKTHIEQHGKAARRSGNIVSKGPLRIGRDVTIGSRVLVLVQVKEIGDGAIISDGAVVTKDVAAGETWEGFSSGGSPK